MRKAIVHIGFHKCGSTAVQAWLMANSAALLEHGFAWRRTCTRQAPDFCGNPQFVELALNLSGQASGRFQDLYGCPRGDLDFQLQYTGEFARDYDSWLAGQHDRTVIISNEILVAGLARPKHVQTFHRWLSQRFDHIRYMAYIRQPAQWMVSHWAQTRRGRRSRLSFAEYLTSHPTTGFAPALRRWLSVVGRDSLDLRLYQEGWRRGRGMEADFRLACGIPAGAKLQPMPQRNVTPRETRLTRWFPGLRRDRTREAITVPAPSLLRQVEAANADGMAWIGETFFPDDPAYRAWLARDHMNSEVKA